MASAYRRFGRTARSVCGPCSGMPVAVPRERPGRDYPIHAEEPRPADAGPTSDQTLHSAIWLRFVGGRVHARSCWAVFRGRWPLKCLKRWAVVRREWAAHSWRWPTTAAPPGGIRRASLTVLFSIRRQRERQRRSRKDSPPAVTRFVVRPRHAGHWLSYYRLRITDIQPFDPTGEGGGNREDRRAGVPVRSLARQFGITISRRWCKASRLERR